MSLVVAVSAMDRIVMVSDGKAVDADTGEISNIPKLFKLSDYCAAAITGMELNNPELFMKTIVTNIAIHKITGVDNIAEYVDKLMKKNRTWADNDKSFMQILIVGFRQNDPIIRAILGNGLSDAAMRMLSFGNWAGANEFLIDTFGERGPEVITFKEAEKVAIQALLKAEEENPESIGEQESVWHVFPDRIEEKTVSYNARLRKKYTI